MNAEHVLVDYACDAAQTHQCARLLARHKLAESNLCVVVNQKQNVSGTVPLRRELGIAPASVASSGGDGDAVPIKQGNSTA